MKLKKELAANVKFFKNQLKSIDVTFFDVAINNKQAAVIFLESFCDKESIGNLLIKPLTELTSEVNESNLEKIFLIPNVKKCATTNDGINEVLSGNTLLLVDGISVSYSFGIKQYEKRSISEPPTSSVVKGPREGFVESFETNISLMRRRIKSKDLIFEKVEVGKYSSTPVILCYIDGVVKKGLKEQVLNKLKNINIDGILDSSYIQGFLSENKTSLFKQVGSTEKPDIFAAKILEGRLGIIVEGSPIALTLPYALIEDFQSPGDYYGSPYKATVTRSWRVLSVLISLYLPAFYVAAQLFHLQLIPLSFLLTIVNSVKGIPLSPSLEMFVTLLIFIILSEASVRMPRNIGMVVSIVGGLVLGETAVNAGIISAPALMIIALSGICLYTVPDLERPFELLRLIFLLIAGSIGGYGIICFSALLLVYLVTFESYGTPVLAPFSPLIKEDLKDSIFKEFTFANTKRPVIIGSSNKTRLKGE